MVDRKIARTRPMRYRDGAFLAREDHLAGEEPLEMRIGGRQFSVTMRTPGHDIELVHGFLHGEGIITDRADIAAVRYCDGVDEQGRNTYNVLDVTLAEGVAAPAADRARQVTTTSACGVCGSASIDVIRQRSRFALTGPTPMDPAVVAGLPDTLRLQQRVFERTGGTHGAALADPAGALTLVREDVGRHNAVDKVIGAALVDGLLGTDRSLGSHALVTSSRASFELVQKAAVAGIGMLVAVSAPSSLAVELATDLGMTLIGFVRNGGFNIYSGAERIDGTAPRPARLAH